jgi:Zn-finger nucleic acid-binding protein
VRLIACAQCHTQYDVSSFAGETFACRCGTLVRNEALKAVEAPIHRCGSCGGPVASDATNCPYCRGEIVREPKLLSLICPECFARNTEASRFCTSCGIPFEPLSVALPAMTSQCVRCDGTLHASRVGGIEVYECAKCHGLWVPEDRFDQLIERAIDARKCLTTPFPRVGGGNPVAERVEYRRCPTCTQLMLRKNYRHRSGVVIDQCREHGTWLDADELEQIAGFVRSGGLEKAIATEVEVGLVASKKKREPRSELVRILSERQPASATGIHPLLRSLSAFLNHLLDG